MKKTRNAMNKWGFSILAALMLLCLVFGASAAEAEVELNTYADISCELYMNSDKEALPTYVENGQNLFFCITFDLLSDPNSYPPTNPAYFLRKAFQNGEIDKDTIFTVDIKPLNLLSGANYPKSENAGNNIASDNGVDIFR